MYWCYLHQRHTQKKYLWCVYVASCVVVVDDDRNQLHRSQHERQISQIPIMILIQQQHTVFKSIQMRVSLMIANNIIQRKMKHTSTRQNHTQHPYCNMNNDIQHIRCAEQDALLYFLNYCFLHTLQME